MQEDYRARVRELNDAFRQTFEGGLVFITRGVEGTGYAAELLDLVRHYDTFNSSNDPYGEHDFGVIDHRGEKYFWKLDYFDRDLRFHSPDKADPDLTRRVLTVMKAEEY
jgi:hypothetical protein